MPIPRTLALFPAMLLLLPPVSTASAAPDDRLGRIVVPVAESVELDLDARDARYRGRVDIELRVASAVDTFELNALNLDLGRSMLRDEKGSVAIVCTPKEHGRLMVRASRRLVPGNARLTIEFTNDFDASGNGLYSYREAGRSFIASQFQSVAAREAFPCWDEPDFKIPWTISVTAPRGDLVLSNAPVDREVVTGAHRTVHFRTTPPLPSYLVALIAGPYETTPIEGLSVPGRIVHVPDRDGLAREAVRITQRILTALELYFGRPYPFEKLDLIALPEFPGGAMENAAAITFGEPYLLLDPDNTTPGDRRFFVTTLVHEIAHMWFGDLVTMEWWDDLWLNESFATWMENKLTTELFPEFNLDLATRQFAERAMNGDARPSARAVRSRVSAFDNPDLLFDAFSYEKGGAVLAMIESWIGEQAFRQGVRTYLDEYAWGSATADDLWRCLEEASDMPVRDAARSFIEQPGVPFVEVRPMPGGLLAVTQRPFVPAGSSAGPYLWTIPLTLRYPEEGREVPWLLDSAVDTLAALDVGVPGVPLPNAGALGYCRWAVPGDVLDRIAAVPDRLLTPRERLDFVYNLGALFEAGLIDGNRYLDLLSRFGNDPESEVVLAVVEALEDVRSTFGGAYPEAGFRNFVRASLERALVRIGFDPAAGEPEPVTLLRPRLILALADLGGDTAAGDRIKPEARAWLEGKEGIHPSLVDAGLALLVSDGDSALVGTILDRLEVVSDPTDRQRLLGALGGFRSPETVAGILEHALHRLPRSSEALQVIRSLSLEPTDNGRVFRWVVQNYDALTARLPAYRVAMLPLLARNCDPALLPEVRAFFGDPDHQAQGTLVTLEDVVARIEQRAALREREQGNIARKLGGG